MHLNGVTYLIYLLIYLLGCNQWPDHGTTEYRGIFFTVSTVAQNSRYGPAPLPSSSVVQWLGPVGVPRSVRAS